MIFETFFELKPIEIVGFVEEICWEATICASVSLDVSPARYASNHAEIVVDWLIVNASCAVRGVSALEAVLRAVVILIIRPQVRRYGLSVITLILVRVKAQRTGGNAKASILESAAGTGPLAKSVDFIR